MDFLQTAPEKKGISSKAISKYIDVLEKQGLSTHDIIIARGEDIVFEAYWKPFCEDLPHRMYSVTKSFVSIAAGFAIDDGLLSLDDTVEKLLPEYMEGDESEYFKKQTVRNMLMMSTNKKTDNWFIKCRNNEDRVRHYCRSVSSNKPAGTVWEYDSTGSFVVGAIVERVTGMSLDEYLREKLYRHIGVSDKAHILKCPGGHSWGDSALLCTARDLLKVARFMLDGGKADGKQLLSADYVKEATSKLIDNCSNNFENFDRQGYGYLIWRCRDNSFFFNGMGCQFAICIPDKDIIFIYNGDNQGIDIAKNVIIDNFFDIVANTASDKELCEDKEAHTELLEKAKGLKLSVARGEKYSDFEEKINGKTFKLLENPMGITDVRLEFDTDGGRLCYTNEQGYKELPFGRCENDFSYFPQEGYSKDVGSVRVEGHKYRCATSAAWRSERKFYINCQIIDDYFGRLHIVLEFTKDLQLGVLMQKTAEDFLDEYSGFALGYLDNAE